MTKSRIRELPDGARQQRKIIHIPSEQRTEITVGCAGCARYSAVECRPLAGTRVVPQRYNTFVS